MRIADFTSIVDGRVSDSLYFATEVSCDVLLKFAAIAAVSPAFAGPGIVISVIGGALCRIFMKAQLSVKREMSNAKAPVMGHIGAAITGLGV